MPESASRGKYLVRGVYLVLGGGVLSPGGCLVWGVWSQGGVCSGGSGPGGSALGGSGPGGCPLQGVSGPRGVSAPVVGGLLRGVSAHEADTPLWTESQTPVKTLPWPNFVAAGNYERTNFNRKINSLKFTRSQFLRQEKVPSVQSN